MGAVQWIRSQLGCIKIEQREWLEAVPYAQDEILDPYTNDGTDLLNPVEIALTIVVQGDYVEKKTVFHGPVAAGNIGDHNTIEALTRNTVNAQSQTALAINLQQLAAELAALRSAVGSRASAPEHYGDLGFIASAEKAAEEGDRQGALNSLKKVGVWLWDVATKIGVGTTILLAKEAIT